MHLLGLRVAPLLLSRLSCAVAFDAKYRLPQMLSLPTGEPIDGCTSAQLLLNQRLLWHCQTRWARCADQRIEATWLQFFAEQNAGGGPDFSTCERLEEMWLVVAGCERGSHRSAPTSARPPCAADETNFREAAVRQVCTFARTLGMCDDDAMASELRVSLSRLVANGTIAIDVLNVDWVSVALFLMLGEPDTLLFCEHYRGNRNRRFVFPSTDVQSCAEISALSATLEIVVQLELPKLHIFVSANAGAVAATVDCWVRQAFMAVLPWPQVRLYFSACFCGGIAWQISFIADVLRWSSRSLARNVPLPLLLADPDTFDGFEPDLDWQKHIATRYVQRVKV